MSAFFVSLVQPYFLLLVLIGVALWRLTRAAKPGWGRTLLLWSPYLVLVVLSCPLTAYCALGSLEWRNPALARRPEDVEAIVVLAAGYWPANNLRPEAELDLIGRARLERAAAYYHQQGDRPIPILVSGGPASGGTDAEPVADLMRDYLVRLNVPRDRILLERTSTTTAENATQSAVVLREHKLERVLLLTTATHLPRAAACFRKAGVDVVPAGCYYQATGWDLSWGQVQPQLWSLVAVQEATHEWLGLAWYWACGRI